MTEGWLVMPAFNEEQGIAAHLDSVRQFLSAYGAEAGVRFVILVVDDGSSDRTRERVRSMVHAFSDAGTSLRLLPFVRNFGHQAALVAGLVEASKSADFAITLDADGEHPLSLIPALVDAWRAGSPIVHTVRRPHQELGWLKRRCSSLYYSLLSRVSGVRIRPGMADFKLWDGTVLREVRSFLPSCGSTRVFASWIAPMATAIEYDQRVVPGRISRFTLRKNLSLALNGVIRYTDAPLRLSLAMSVFAGVVAAGHSLFVLWASIEGLVVPGWASIVIIVAFFGALQSFSIGILGEYLLRISFRSSLPRFVTASASPPAEKAHAPSTS
jgi:glycosyltransferase involved in cell wall biosynthesis